GKRQEAEILQQPTPGRERGGGGLSNAQRLLLDSRVVDVPMAYNPIVVTLSSLKPFFFNGLQSGGALLGPWWSIRPRNPIRASEFCGSPQPLHALPRIRPSVTVARHPGWGWVGEDLIARPAGLCYNIGVTRARTGHAL